MPSLLMRTFEYCGASEYGVVCALVSTAAALTVVANKLRLLKNVRAVVIGLLTNMTDRSYAGRRDNKFVGKLCCSLTQDTNTFFS
jgi:hypothetical protein